MAGEPTSLETEELRARIVRTIHDAEKLAAETGKLIAEMEKYQGDLKFQPWTILFQGALAVTALIGAGIAVAKLFLT